MGITILRRRDRAIRKIPKTTRKDEWRLGAGPQAYEIRIVIFYDLLIPGFRSFKWKIFLILDLWSSNLKVSSFDSLLCTAKTRVIFGLKTVFRILFKGFPNTNSHNKSLRSFTLENEKRLSRKSWYTLVVEFGPFSSEISRNWALTDSSNTLFNLPESWAGNPLSRDFTS